MQGSNEASTRLDEGQDGVPASPSRQPTVGIKYVLRKELDGNSDLGIYRVQDGVFVRQMNIFPRGGSYRLISVEVKDDEATQLVFQIGKGNYLRCTAAEFSELFYEDRREKDGGVRPAGTLTESPEFRVRDTISERARLILADVLGDEVGNATSKKAAEMATELKVEKPKLDPDSILPGMKLFARSTKEIKSDSHDVLVRSGNVVMVKKIEVNTTKTIEGTKSVYKYTLEGEVSVYDPGEGKHVRQSKYLFVVSEEVLQILFSPDTRVSDSVASSMAPSRAAMLASGLKAPRQTDDNQQRMHVIGEAARIIKAADFTPAPPPKPASNSRNWDGCTGSAGRSGGRCGH